MKFFIIILLFLHLLYFSFEFSSYCDIVYSEEKCIGISNCLWAENKYSSYSYGQCIYFDNNQNMKNFCRIYHELNKEEGFKTVKCMSQTYTFK
jgi:hypothetical protein